MALVDELSERVSDILRTGWNIRDGRKVPLPGDIQLGGDAVSLYGALLYAEIANSTQMVETFTDKFSARVFQSFVYCCCRVVRKHGGVITSFDGDRVMGGVHWTRLRVSSDSGGAKNQGGSRGGD